MIFSVQTEVSGDIIDCLNGPQYLTAMRESHPRSSVFLGNAIGNADQFEQHLSTFFLAQSWHDFIC